MYIFLVIGLFVIIASFFSDQLKGKLNGMKLVAFAIIFGVVGIFIFIGAKRLYEDFFEAYPSVRVEKFSENIFEEYNLRKDKYEGEEYLDVVNESSRNSCDGEYCRKVTMAALFEAADIDSNKRVTKQELYNLINKFDTNKDGLINFPEAKIKTLFEEEKKCEVQIFYSAYPPVYGKSLRRENK